jgi:hypothetical protein
MYASLGILEGVQRAAILEQVQTKFMQTVAGFVLRWRLFRL